MPNGEGSATVTVYNPDGQSGDSPDPFTWIEDPPAILTVTPNRGPDTGGTVLDVFGSGIDRVVEARLGGAVVSTGFTIVDEGHPGNEADPHPEAGVIMRVTD